MLDTLLDDAFERGGLEENSILHRELFNTEIIGRLTLRLSRVVEKFNGLRRWGGLFTCEENTRNGGIWRPALHGGRYP